MEREVAYVRLIWSSATLDGLSTKQEGFFDGLAVVLVLRQTVSTMIIVLVVWTLHAVVRQWLTGLLKVARKSTERFIYYCYLLISLKKLKLPSLTVQFLKRIHFAAIHLHFFKKKSAVISASLCFCHLLSFKIKAYQKDHVHTWEVHADTLYVWLHQQVTQ